MSENRKADKGKAPVYQGVVEYFPRALRAVAMASKFGAEKYGWGNWKQDISGEAQLRYMDAMMRHYAASSWELKDPESKLRHTVHAAWSALAALEIELELVAREASGVVKSRDRSDE